MSAYMPTRPFRVRRRLFAQLCASRIVPADFGGRAEDDGIGDGKGYTRNHPLAIGTSEVDYLATLQRGIADVVAFEPTYLVVRCAAIAGVSVHEDLNPQSWGRHLC
jgi:hypothetical protein